MKKPIIIFSLMCMVYVSSYIFLRENYSRYDEVDGCPADGCKSVVFPENKIFLTYSPLILTDGFVTGTKIYIKNW